MKKVISMLLAVLMVCTCTFVTFAAESIDIEAKKALETVGGYIPPQRDIAATEYTNTENHSFPKAVAKYDLRDYGLTPAVRSQGSAGWCWAFGTITSAESNLLMKKAADSSIDLSELQLAYYTYHLNTDPTGGLAGDKMIMGSGYSYVDCGGNMDMTAKTLARRAGLVDESLAPFDPNANIDIYKNWKPSAELEYGKNSYTLTGASIVSLNDRNTVKNMIMTKGAAAVAYAHYSEYMNYSTNAYYCDSLYYGNHVVSIVGWDDNYSRNNFNSAHRPTSNGAWLCQNSWGTNWGDKGYFYISYEDVSLGDYATQDVPIAHFFEVEPADNLEKIYQYDGGASLSAIGADDRIYAANVFTAQEDEALTKVSIDVSDANTNYRFAVYTDVAISPTSGKISGAWQRGKFENVGVAVVELDNPVYLEKGKKYSVVFCLERKNSDVYMPIDRDVDWGVIEYDTKNRIDESFVSLDGERWEDLYIESDAVARIKAITKPISDKYVRIFGNSRYETANEIAKYGWTKAENVVLTSGLDYADALCSVPYAAKLDAPILLTSGKTLETVVIERLSALGTKSITIVGGDGVVSDEVKEKLEQLGYNVTRIFGNNRYETCIRVAEELEKINGRPEKYAVVTGLGYADALSISPYAALTSMPIIYSHPTVGLFDVCKEYIEENCQENDEVFIIAGSAAVSVATEEQLKSYCNNVERVFGIDRFETSLAIIKRFASEFSNDVVLATGNNFPDALAGGVLAAKLDTPIMLVNSANRNQHLKVDAIEYIKTSSPEKIYILGGVGVVPETVKALLG